ncbi:hypothetical protein [Christiangramia portivictoriae]|uniref:hypothetical protein n=1 Tax=Christiangramia portivictoriae TaxID=326069 RepID=UPI000406B1AD|nr:hypothetical protein [Christiangramia portivictoriae]
MKLVKPGFYGVILLFFALSLYSCTPVSIENNKRILVQGKFVTPEGTALQGIRVSTITDINSFLSRGQGTLSEALSDQNGNISMVSLDVNPGILCLDITGTSNDRRLQSFTVCDSAFSRNETLLDLGEWVLKELIETRIIIRHNSDFNYSLKFESSSVEININDWNELNSYDEADLDSKYSTREGFINSENQVETLKLITADNSRVNLQLQNAQGVYIYEFEVDEIDNHYEIDL